MDAEIIAIGSELLLGETIDSNSAFIARRLHTVGVAVLRTGSVGDDLPQIVAALHDALSRVGLIVCTGGLGPTADDLTREAVAAAFGRPLERRADLLAAIETRLRGLGRVMSPSNERQAYVPAGARAIANPNGTAPAFLVEDQRGTVVALPGVPHEMRALIDGAVLPYLRNERGCHEILLVRSLKAAGLQESLIGERIEDLMRASNPFVGISAKRGQYTLRIAARATSEAEANALIDSVAAEITRRLGDYLLGDERLDQLVGRLLHTHGLSLALADGSVQAPLYRAFAAEPQCTAALRGVRITPLDRPADLAAAQRLASAAAAEARDRWRADIGVSAQHATAEPGAYTPVALALASAQGITEYTRSFDLAQPEGWEMVGTAALELARAHLQSL